MNENQWGILLLGLGIGVALILIMNQNGPAASALPAHVYDNEETWEIQRDSKGKAVKLTVHRDARMM